MSATHDLVTGTVSSPARSGTRAVESAIRNLKKVKFAQREQLDVLTAARDVAVDELFEFLADGPQPGPGDDLDEVTWEFDDGTSQPAMSGTTEDDVVAHLRTYLATGTVPDALPDAVALVQPQTGVIRTARVADVFEIVAREHRLSEDDRALLDQLTVDVRDRWHETVRALRGWLQAPDVDTADDFGQLLRAWREALLIPGKTAADVLGVSPPTITRYEKGSRSPSRNAIESMIRRIIDHGHDRNDDTAAAITSASMMFDRTPAELLDSLDAVETNRERARELISATLDELTTNDLELIARLITSPAALTTLHDLAPTDELAELRRALENRRET